METCLNSRLLYVLHEDPTVFEPLTPGHFLTGDPLTALPDQELRDVNIHRLNRWQLIQRVVQDRSGNDGRPSISTPCKAVLNGKNHNKISK